MHMERGFTSEEFEQRCQRIQKAMHNRDVDALLLSSEAEIRYFTGFMTQFWQSPTRPWFILIPADGKPIAIIPTIGVPLMQDCYVGDIKSWPSPAEDDDGISLVYDAITSHMGSKSRLGMLMGRETAIRMPLADLDRLRARLTDIEWVNMTTDVQHIRMIKSPAEIAKSRHVCGMVSSVFADLPNWVTAGLPLRELFREFKIRALQAGIDDVSYLVGSAGPGGYFDIIAPPDGRMLAAGDVFMLDTGCIWDGYFSDFDRNFAIGHATDDAKSAHHQLYDATEAALDILKPGITASDLFHAMDNILRPDADPDDGGGDVGRYGHGLGTQLTETPSHTIWDKTVIEAGMALTIEPSIIYGDGFLMVAEENLVVTKDGFELLSYRADRDLPIIA
ncbi:metallopeptidase, family M24 [Candidatus Puniceispirillum marinum IMCC1322]|uniref:Metallopeptidase, family M24 n=2 Tax=Candidatus Puniceispirillum TaxID=767891 RepID=D5BRW5_PUNMI|nr:metallopeptidase, family M24 [Candidatus Puniceispirillum marinum IMCC1322]